MATWAKTPLTCSVAEDPRTHMVDTDRLLGRGWSAEEEKELLEAHRSCRGEMAEMEKHIQHLLKGRLAFFFLCVKGMQFYFEIKVQVSRASKVRCDAETDKVRFLFWESVSHTMPSGAWVSGAKFILPSKRLVLGVLPLVVRQSGRLRKIYTCSIS